ncbi:hypothetical protein SLEP1_g18214 [Rubroshorea leprosula]|uniref:Reverse transcriptase domain-containing protein n=1 Tax=Rubroshorea leprosula TaxID=152421 RepID=A0AAV5J7C7_9ROSI|nr:hypothetical protein SLEP1_g18214 [Rubroshorea leprosula]
MVRRLNDIWFGSYKLRVKIVEERSNGRVQKADTEGRKQHKVDRLVQLGQSYAQAVKGKEQESQNLLIRGRTIDRDERAITHWKKTPIQARQQKRKEEVASSDTVNIKKWMVENSDLETQEEIMEFIPEQSELQWLEGGMVVIIKSLTIINEIQQRIDVEGGLITLAPLGGRKVLLTEKEPGFLLEFMKLNKEVLALWFEDIQSWDKEVQERSRMVWLRISGIPLKAWSDRCFMMIGESVGEVIKIHKDTKMKSILCDGRMLVISPVDHKISKRITLKVEEKLYEIRVDEEEWRSDPDWWLSNDERRGESLTESDQSSEQSSEHSLEQIDEEDQDWINFEFCDEEDVGIDEEQLMKDGHRNSNSNFINTEEERERRHTDEGNKGREDVGNGSTKDIGPKTTKEIGLGEIGLKVADGLGRDLSHGQKMRIKKKGPEETKDEGTLPKPDLDLRRKEIGKLVREERPDFLFLQESKLERVDDDLSRTVWNSRECGWVMKESIGASGGLLCFWNKKNFDKTGDHTGDGYLRISGEWGIHKVKCSLVNVYGPNDRQKRLKLWDELRNMITEEGGRWLIAGDFNAVRCLEERRGRTGESLDMREFDAFILSAGLIDFKMGLKRNISDHCAIVLKSRTTDWGPKPFRVLDAWLLHPDFKKIIEEKWKAMEVDGFAGYKCKQKLKGLKEFLKGWNRNVFGDMEAQYEQALKQIEQIDMKNEELDLEEFEILQRQEGFQKMSDIMRKREVIWKQKSRSNWVKKEAMNYFSKLFQEDKWNRPKPYGINFKQIFTEENQWLERPFSTEEIKKALRSCEGSKAPGPDGPTEEFKVEKGLRQGDPLSPFLFLMIGEGLNGLVQKAVTEGLFRGVEIGRKGLESSLLQFADDTIIMGKADTENVFMVKTILRWFELMSGLRINFSKSSIYGYNVPVRWVEGSAGMLRCGVGKSPFIYLGLPVDGNSGRTKLWEPLINKFQAKLTVWKAASLSFGGRLTLLNSECKISDMGVCEGDKWHWDMEWRRERIGREKDEEEKLREGLERLQLKKRVEDRWRWTHDSEGRYGVKKAYDFLAPTECVIDEQWSKLIWCKLVPSKVSFFGWRLCLDRLPTKWNLRKRGVPLQEEELKCVLCKDKVEEVNHLFSMCKEVWIFWVELLQWWGMVTVMPNNALSVADIFVNDLGRIIGKEMGACIFLVAAWYLWYWRNNEVFNNGRKEGVQRKVWRGTWLFSSLRAKIKYNGSMHDEVATLNMYRAFEMLIAL